MAKQVRVNIRALMNTTAVRKAQRNGRDVLIVPSATLPDDVVMNGIKYPAAEIEKSYLTLNRTPAPLGHPIVNGKFVSASDPEGINQGYIGAWNENARRENGRVFIDKVIDIGFANQSDGGKAVLAAINKGEAVHTSTGLLCNLEATNEDGCEHIARNIYFDHDAILLNEEGAATPAQGVGMFVNASGEKLDVINSALEDADREMDWAVDHLARSLDRLERASMLDQLKAAILKAFAPMLQNPTQQTAKEMLMDKEQFDALNAKVNDLAKAHSGIGDAITAAVNAALKPVLDAQAEITANAKAKDEAELASHVAAIVKANILDEESAKELTLNAARKLAAKATPGKAAALNGALGNAGAEVYDFNEVMGLTNKKEA